MSKKNKILLNIFFIILVGCFFYLRSSLPLIDGKVNIGNLKSEVSVIRDNWGIPHIYSKDQVGAFKVYGYTVAGDRLFQMDIHRRVASGTLSEIIGKDGLKIDILMRSLRLRSHMKEHLQENISLMDKSMLECLDGFLEGVNEYIDKNKLPIEFDLLGYTPSKFNRLDVFSFIGYMGFSFAISLKQDILLTNLKKKFSNEMFDLLRYNSGKISDNLDLFSSKLPLENDGIVQDSIDFLMNGFSLFEGSNSWVISGKHTKSGFPILASDPHISFSNPGIWYEAYMDTDNYKMYGHHLPLIPFPVIGHNKQFGWTVTMSYVDEIDIYNEEINSDRTQVKYKSKWVDLKVEKISIKVKGNNDFNFDLKITPHGPLLNHVYKKQDLSLKWTYYLKENMGINALYSLGHSNSMEEFKGALQMGTSPGLNISYADKLGNIGWWIFGKVPIRPEGVRGDTVLDGRNGDQEYLGYIDFKDLPFQENPESGIIVSANSNPPVDNPSVVGNWSPPYRYGTILTLLQSKERWTIDELKEIQSAPYNLYNKEMVLDFLESISEKIGPIDQLYGKIFKKLKKWDLRSTVDSSEAAFFYSWKRILERAILDELSEKERKLFCTFDSKEYFLKRLLKDASSRWWDLSDTEKIEDKADILFISFKQTVLDLTKRFGDDFDSWKWGDIHKLEFVHPIGRKKPLNYIFNLGPYPSPGAYNDINNLRDVGCEADIKVKAGPSTRILIDFASPEVSFGILPTGISGHLLSKYYGDQTSLFMAGKYRLQIIDREVLEKNKDSQTVFY